MKGWSYVTGDRWLTMSAERVHNFQGKVVCSHAESVIETCP